MLAVGSGRGARVEEGGCAEEGGSGREGSVAERGGVRQLEAFVVREVGGRRGGEEGAERLRHEGYVCLHADE